LGVSFSVSLPFLIILLLQILQYTSGVFVSVITFILLSILFILSVFFVVLKSYRINGKKLLDIEKIGSFDYYIGAKNKNFLAHELAHIYLHKKWLNEAYFEGFRGGFRWWFSNVENDLQVVDLLKKYHLNASGRLWLLEYFYIKTYQLIGNLLNKVVPIK